MRIDQKAKQNCQLFLFKSLPASFVFKYEIISIKNIFNGFLEFKPRWSFSGAEFHIEPQLNRVGRNILCEVNKSKQLNREGRN